MQLKNQNYLLTMKIQRYDCEGLKIKYAEFDKENYDILG
jgi:hypothetical protein